MLCLQCYKNYQQKQKVIETAVTIKSLQWKKLTKMLDCRKQWKASSLQDNKDQQTNNEPTKFSSWVRKAWFIVSSIIAALESIKDLVG